MYIVVGERLLIESPFDWLGGFEDSRPVRIGNAAHDQFQLGTFGDVIIADGVATVTVRRSARRTGS